MQSFLYAGVTSVLDPADSSGEATSRRDRVARGELIGPRIQTSGKMITCPGGHPVALTELFAPAAISWLITPGMAHQVETREEAHAAVDSLAKEGVDVIKVAVDRLPPQAPRISVATMQAIDQRTRRHDLRWVAHVGSLEDAIDAGEAGVSLWVHGIARERLSDADVERLASFDIPMVVTIEVMDRMLRGLEAPIDPIPMERETVPQEVLDSFYPPPERFRELFDGFGSLGEEGTGDLDVRAINAENTLRLRDAGVTILAGSDSQGGGVFPGASLHRELAQLVRAGLSPAEAIRAATLDPATWLANGEPLEFGAVRVGLQADLLLVEGDPTEDIARLQDIHAVMVAGIPLERSPVQEVAPTAH
jgi:imidazolonepropionase-like amidohydrolase